MLPCTIFQRRGDYGSVLRSARAGPRESRSVREGQRKKEVPLYWLDDLPSLRGAMRALEAHFHNLRNFMGPRIGEKIHIAAEIGPMIEGFHHRDNMSTISECGTYLIQTRIALSECAPSPTKER